VDPGARWQGIAVTVGDAEPLAALHLETRELGRVVPLPRPKKKTRRDGSEYIITERRAVEWPDVVALADAVVALAREYGCTHATVEHAREAYTTGDGKAAGAQAHGIARTAEAGGVIAYALGTAGMTVRRPMVSTVRARVAGRADVKGDARKGLVGVAVATRIHGWPADTDAHMRDAGALALWDVLPPPAPPAAPRPARARPGTAVKRVLSEEAAERHRKCSREREARLAAERRAEKIAAGCIGCRSRHRRECPMYVQRLRGLS
jgi:hypothetical protein